MVLGADSGGSWQRLLRPAGLGSWDWVGLVATLRSCTGAFPVTLGGAHWGGQCRDGEDRCRGPASWSASLWFWGQWVPMACGAWQCPGCPALQMPHSDSQGVGGLSAWEAVRRLMS